MKITLLNPRSYNYLNPLVFCGSMHNPGKQGSVVVIGLGYVGLPLACLSSSFYNVVGFDIDQKKLDKINNCICPLDEEYTKKLFAQYPIIATSDPGVLHDADIIVMCVPTPVDEHFNPDLGPVKGASATLAQQIRKGQLIIIESTIYPGTTEEVIIPILEQNPNQLKAGVDFGVAYCPERIDPGNKRWVLETIPRVVGGLTEKDLNRAQHFYQSFIRAPLTPLRSLKAAEAVKILENTFRDVNIAFINEIAKSFDVLGIDVWEVIKGASTKPFGFMPFYPGPGVGGHCISVDPYYLIEKADRSGFDHAFLKLARKINNSMPDYVVHLLESALTRCGLDLQKTRVGILGLSYKAGVDDIRESPALKIIRLLLDKQVQVAVFDPHIVNTEMIFHHPLHASDKPKISLAKNLDACLASCDALILVTNHAEFLEREEIIAKYPLKVVIDTRNVLNKEKLEASGIIYKGVGR